MVHVVRAAYAAGGELRRNNHLPSAIDRYDQGQMTNYVADDVAEIARRMREIKCEMRAAWIRMGPNPKSLLSWPHLRNRPMSM